MSNITYQTPRGAQIEIRLDQYGIAVTINGANELRSIRLADHAAHGLCIQTTLGQAVIIPVPASVADAVRKLFADRAAAVQADLAADVAYAARARRIMES